MVAVLTTFVLAVVARCRFATANHQPAYPSADNAALGDCDGFNLISATGDAAMTVRELKKILDQCSDETLVLVTRTVYNGWRDETSVENADCYLSDEGIVLADVNTVRFVDEYDDLGFSEHMKLNG